VGWGVGGGGWGVGGGGWMMVHHIIYLVIYPGSTPVGNATLVVANVLTCNKHSHIPH
jgi:hypothetical protein